ncbi:outer membrane beta-barrel protein [Neorhizobium sp. BETTINA12A]|uniref:outer membrane beta-barrel protein n=1 Tax=Neorhizobium sp. BETTINA12A TaxID=2908924 RepID=UPI001FF4FD6A|nr:outer membrane beta-barrel protein [Neorhizobium sp. BETTINA12A]MCJ9754429.1 outer membrane beta-barrel protein [Neorhizobium sp. BETTINA12A]
MKIITTTGGTRQRRRTALGLLLACSALVSPAAAQTRNVFPPQSGSLPSVTDTSSPASNPASGAALRGNTSAQPSASAADDQNQDDPNVATGTTPGRNRAATQEPPYEDDLNQPHEEPLDRGAEPVETQEQPREPGDPTGIRMGSFLLRPSINQGINTEIRRSSGTKIRRDYLSTAIRGTLTSDWSRHSLTITGEGTLERNLGSSSQGEQPEANINADLRLDLSNDTVAHVTGGYKFSRENDYDPNALGGASTQSGVHEFTGGASVQRDFGKIRGTAALDLSRASYTDAKLSDGTIVSMKDRNRTGIDGRLRLGYELSPALVPYVEVATGHTFYDLRHDNSGYARSSQSYAARTGVEFDLGEKLRGEIGTGYEVVDYEDDRLKSVGAVTFSGSATWSPQRGTNIDLGLRTTVQDSTTPGQSGWVEYRATAALTHEMRDNLIARLTGSSTLRNFPSGGPSDETVWIGGAGLTWAINRYLDLTGDVEYEQAGGGGTNDKIVRAGVGLTLKR